MNWRFALILGSIIISIPMFFIGVVLEYGVSHRQPASLTLTTSACQLLPDHKASSAGNGMCRLDVDDFQQDGKMVELWVAKNDQEIFAGQTITLPAEALKMALSQPRRPTPMWIKSLPYAGMFLMLGSVVAFGLSLRKNLDL